eukprot:augustus_masked-scaffold_31-processed-gene-2.53-mRNA-1 protein AED:1.00 eAED:1.00 QI:723/0/0/0/1/1/6/0/162
MISRKVGREVKVIRNEKDTLLQLLKEFRDQVEANHGKVVDYVSLMKSKHNAYWNKKGKLFHKALLHFQFDEWCLISTAMTPRKNNKIKLESLDPSLVKYFCLNDFEQFSKYMLHKSKAMMYSYMQRSMGIMFLAQFNAIRIDIKVPVLGKEHFCHLGHLEVA